MKGYPLDREVSIPELLKMREQGMSNPEIAASLDVSPHTIWSYIGPGPRSKNRNRGGTPVSAEIKKEEPIAACLKVEPTVVRLTGAFGCYEVNKADSLIAVELHPDGDTDAYFDIPLDQLTTFIKELQAIERNVDRVKTQLEVW